MKRFKKMISLIVCVFLLTNLIVPACAIEEYDFSIGELDYIVSEKGNNTVLRSFLDGEPYDEVEIVWEKNELIHTSFFTKTAEKRSISVEDRVKDNFTSASASVRSSYSPKTGLLGSIRYRAVLYDSIVYRTITCRSTLIDSKQMAKTFYGEAGDTVSIILSLMMIYFGASWAPILQVMATASIGKLSKQLTSALSFTLDGTAYWYEISASINDGTNRTEYEDGYVFYGKMIVDGQNSNVYRTVRDGCYPEFLEEEDTTMAMRVYDNFYNDLYYIDQYFPN